MSVCVTVFCAAFLFHCLQATEVGGGQGAVLDLLDEKLERWGAEVDVASLSCDFRFFSFLILLLHLSDCL